MARRLTGYLNREGEPLPLIVQNSVGGYNYATTDLACVIDRVERLKVDRMVYVVGAPQAQHLAMVFAVSEMAGWLAPGVAVHVAFGNVLGADRKMLKSRSGESLKLNELLNEALERAEAAVVDKNPDLPAAERTAVAHAIGIGAVKYADLSTDRIKDYVFEWDRMLAFDGNTAPYLQYAHARICSLFRRAEVDRASVRNSVPVPRATSIRRSRPTRATTRISRPSPQTCWPTLASAPWSLGPACQPRCTRLCTRSTRGSKTSARR